MWRWRCRHLDAAILEAYDDRTRSVFVADSFQGVPPPDLEAYPADEGSELHNAKALAIPPEDVERNFDLYGLLDDRVKVLEGGSRIPSRRCRTGRGR